VQREVTSVKAVVVAGGGGEVKEKKRNVPAKPQATCCVWARPGGYKWASVLGKAREMMF
jgi:hypothetical protein